MNLKDAEQVLINLAYGLIEQNFESSIKAIKDSDDPLMKQLYKNGTLQIEIILCKTFLNVLFEKQKKLFREERRMPYNRRKNIVW